MKCTGCGLWVRPWSAQLRVEMIRPFWLFPKKFRLYCDQCQLKVDAYLDVLDEFIFTQDDILHGTIIAEEKKQRR